MPSTLRREVNLSSFTAVMTNSREVVHDTHASGLQGRAGESLVLLFHMLLYQSTLHSNFPARFPLFYLIWPGVGASGPYHIFVLMATIFYHSWFGPFPRRRAIPSYV